MHRCTHCSFVTLYKQSLNYHLRAKHSEKEEGPNTTESLTCKFCDYKTNRPYNFTRHLITKHNIYEETAQNQDNASPPEQEHDDAKSQSQSQNQNQKKEWFCDKCERYFTRKSTLQTHSIRCRKVPLNTCEFCHKVFSFASNRRRHEVTCDGEECLESVQASKAALAAAGGTQHVEPPVSQNITHLHFAGNQVNNTQNIHITNNIQVIQFPDKINYDEPVFITSEEQKAKLLQFIQTKGLKKPEDILEAIMLFFDDPRRMAFRKQNLHMPYTHVHKGDLKWELKPDEDVYPTVLAQTGQDITHVLEKAAYDLPNQRERAKVALRNSADIVGTFVDEVEYIKQNGMPPGRITDRERTHRKIFRTATKHLKIKAADSYKMCPIKQSQSVSALEYIRDDEDGDV